MERSIEDYLKLAEVDFKNLENYFDSESNMTDMLRMTLLDNIIERYKSENYIIYDYDRWFDWKYEKVESENGEIAYKQKRGIHLDDSDGKNPFVRGIYYALWGKRIGSGKEFPNDKTESGIGVYEYGWGNFRTSYVSLLPKFSKDGKEILWGADTMNTIAFYKKEIEDFANIERESVDELCRKCHSLGNFVLVPAYYNRCRGGKDQIDVALHKLYDGRITYEFSLRKSNKGEGEDKSEKANSKFQIWDKGVFVNYINLFFLWDYVEPEGKKYSVKNMKTGEIIDRVNQVKIDKENIGQYIANANAYIERRGIFMAGMLKIALEFEDTEYSGKNKTQWKDWKVSGIYKQIVEQVFLNDKPYAGFEAVLTEIENVVNSKDFNEKDRIKDVLGKICEKMDIKIRV